VGPGRTESIAGQLSVEVVGHGVAGVDGGFGGVAVDEECHACAVVAELVGDGFDGDAGFGHEAGGGVAEFVWVPVAVAEFLGGGGEGAGDVAWVAWCAVCGGEHEVSMLGGPCRPSRLALVFLAIAVFEEDVCEWWRDVEAAA
jgi:hypothetical protein